VPTYNETRDYLYALKNRGSKFGIERMVRLVDALGHPEHKFPVIHVAGTNGKGSVCAMLEALYRSNGYKTGLFTSPHLVHLGERAQVNREILTESGIARYVEELRPVGEKLCEEDAELHPTFFEFVAAMAFLHFASHRTDGGIDGAMPSSGGPVDIALIETGLGGRLDATNVVDPELSIITSISFDHMEQLGDTLGKIATEKAGIIKPGKPVLIGCLPEEAEAVIRAIADERASPFYSVRERFTEAELPETNLAGQFQRWNAAVAVHATELLADRFPIASTGGLMAVDWAGRWQQLDVAGRTLILDATHNPEGAAALRANLERLTQAEGKPVIVAGTLGEDRGRGLMAAVAPFARELFLVEANQERATSTEFLCSCLPAERKFAVHPASVEDLFGFQSVTVPGVEQNATIVVTGSIYLIGEVLDRLTRENSGGSGRLQDKI
jgi:dihydrofolate synthase/folylpolyglutamate synthase